MLELLLSNPYPAVLTLTLLLSPSVLNLASSQAKETKQQLKFIFIIILFAQIILGFLNWENFTIGRSGFWLALSYQSSFLGLFFITSVTQIALLTLNKSFNNLAIVLNFINSALIFVYLIRLSNFLGFQAVSFASIGSVFLVLIGNVVGLAYINKDKSLLRKYLR